VGFLAMRWKKKNYGFYLVIIHIYVQIHTLKKPSFKFGGVSSKISCFSLNRGISTLLKPYLVNIGTRNTIHDSVDDIFISGNVKNKLKRYTHTHKKKMMCPESLSLLKELLTSIAITHIYYCMAASLRVCSLLVLHSCDLCS
jgi:hypothetical protein